MGDENPEMRPHPEVLVQKMPNGESVLLSMDSEVYFGLDEVGTRMWDALTETGSLEEAVSRLLEELEVDRKRVQADLRNLADELMEAGLIIREAENAKD